MKKTVRSFTVEYRSKRGKSRTVRGGGASRFSDRSTERMSGGKDIRDELSALRSLFKQEARSL
ncbi:MAG TPA: hypothetical protein VIF88_10145 [Methylocystis sp.]|jgi:hypothetical protein